MAMPIQSGLAPVAYADEIQTNTLLDIIKDRIANDGPISFLDYMNMALYHPIHGYYTSGKEHLGAGGDYYTSVSLTCIFGRLIARQMEEMWGILGKQPFAIVEYGGGDGALCRDILTELKKNEPMYSHLQYYIVEKDIDNRCKMSLPEDKVRWMETVADIPPVNGCVFSNELLDNFPVHRVVMQNELMEIFVDYQDGLIEVWKPAGEPLTNYLRERGITLPASYNAEINLQALDWLQEVSTLLNKGFVVTIDYGYLAAELYSQKRSSGTLMCYRKHQTNTGAFFMPGHKDITARVNFSALCHWGVPI